MKAPDKIYIQPSTINELPRQNIIYTKQLSDTSINYIRKDALLEWAKETYLNENASAIRKVCYKQMIDKIESL